MKRSLHEAKADLELAIVKSLERSPLNLVELTELQDMNTRDLMIDHDLDYVLADRVLTHAKFENYRMRAQNQQTPIEGYKTTATSLTRSWPTNQGLNETFRLNKQDLKKLIRRMISEELRR